MLTEQDMLNRYDCKRAEFEKNAEITLLGHSLFDLWDEIPGGVPNLGGKTVANLGISGITVRQYLELFIKSGKIKRLGKEVFIFLGVNDIAMEEDYSPNHVTDYLLEILRYCRQIAPHARYFLLEATPVNRVNKIDNPAIRLLNTHFAAHCPQEAEFIKTWDLFVDPYGNLAADLSTDGLHFTAEGYDILTRLLCRYV